MPAQNRRRRHGGGGSGSAPRAPKRMFDVTALLAEFVDLNVAAETLGVDRRTLHRWKVYGVDERRADELAVRANLHPMVLWPDEWSASVAESLAADLEPLTLFDPFLD